jgi:hypothetical protein
MSQRLTTSWVERAHGLLGVRSTQKAVVGLSAHDSGFAARSTQTNLVWVERAHPPYPPRERAAPRRHAPLG